MKIPDMTMAAIASNILDGDSWEQAINRVKGSFLPFSPSKEEKQALEDCKEEILAMTKQ